jgi:hypothetical protein
LGVGQKKPGSSLHSASQPSLAFALPSSHCSLPATIPSPHAAATQGTFWIGQIQPELELTGHVAAVGRVGIAIVAGLEAGDDAVAAEHRGDAGLTGEGAGEVLLDREAVGRAAVGGRLLPSSQTSPGWMMPSPQPPSSTPPPSPPPPAALRRQPRRCRR